MSDKKNIILSWPTPSGTLPEFEEVCVKLINPAERANTGNINTLQKAIAYIANVLSESCVERAYIIMLSQSDVPIGYSQISIGSNLRCNFSLSEIARVCILSGASKYVFAHNHVDEPFPEPSMPDKTASTILYDKLGQIGIDMMDFIVVGSDSRFYSFRENRTGPFWNANTYTGDDEEEGEDDEDYH